MKFLNVRFDAYLYVSKKVGKCHPSVYSKSKKCLFEYTPKGVYSSAEIYSLIEIAKVNELNVYVYFE